MELRVRQGADRFVPPGAYRELEARLRAHAAELAEIPAVVFSAFDRRTRMLPFVFADSRLFPCGARSVAASLYQAGFTRTRAVFQLWNPRVDPSRARIDGRAAELFLVSAMQIHARQAYQAVRDAYNTPGDRPLIIVGGSKAIYEPYDFWAPVSGCGAAPASPKLASGGRASEGGPDVVVTGESYVLLDLLHVLVEHKARRETMRSAFERARREGALRRVPGLVYLAPGASITEPELVDTGLQRLVQHFDELPSEVVGLSLLEPPHHRRELAPAPLPDGRVGVCSPVVSLQVTQGCKFNCQYCPIPAANQKSWRFRSPERVVHEMHSVRERFGIREFFGTDDNFFNRRETAFGILAALAAASSSGRIAWMTESTEFDAYKNRDLLPLARAAGMRGLWFGIEDLTATLINKGQNAERTIELFRLMQEQNIRPHAMLMFHDGQPFYSAGSLYGLSNQMDFVRRAGAITAQCTVHIPAVGTREYEKTYRSGRVIKRLGGYEIRESSFDGNHVFVAGGEAAWKRQLQILGGYLAFYNPVNLLRAFRTRNRVSVRCRRANYQLIGMVACIWTATKIIPYALRLLIANRQYHAAPPVAKPVPIEHPPGAFARVPEM